MHIYYFLMEQEIFRVRLLHKKFQHYNIFLDNLTFQLFLGASYKRPNIIK